MDESVEKQKINPEGLSGKVVKEMEILPPEVLDPVKTIQVQNVLETAVPMTITAQSRLELMTVEKTDWERIKTYVSRLKSSSSGYKIAFGFSTGFFANAICTLIGLYTVEPRPTRIITAVYILIAVSFALSVLLGVVINKEANDFKTSKEMIEEELDTVQKKNLL